MSKFFVSWNEDLVLVHMGWGRPLVMGPNAPAEGVWRVQGEPDWALVGGGWHPNLYLIFCILNFSTRILFFFLMKLNF